MEFRAWREDKGNRRKNQVMADLHPALPSLEDGIQEIVCKAKWKWLPGNHGAEARVRSWVGTAWKGR